MSNELFDPALAAEVLYSRQGSRGKVYAFQDGTQIVGTRRARAKVNEMRKAALTLNERFELDRAAVAADDNHSS